MCAVCSNLKPDFDTIRLGVTGVYICRECVRDCVAAFAKRKGMPGVPLEPVDPPPSPRVA
jgi:hypothetical protein